ncbi:MAG: hypothetical protein MZU97_04810 [Bacillus subtilis]|nr:hypothetical protein [Bacillus subtilis]
MICRVEDPANGYLVYFNAEIDLTTDWVVTVSTSSSRNPSITTGKVGFFLGPYRHDQRSDRRLFGRHRRNRIDRTTRRYQRPDDFRRDRRTSLK